MNGAANKPYQLRELLKIPMKYNPELLYRPPLLSKEKASLLVEETITKYAIKNKNINDFNDNPSLKFKVISDVFKSLNQIENFKDNMLLTNLKNKEDLIDFISRKIKKVENPWRNDLDVVKDKFEGVPISENVHFKAEVKKVKKFSFRGNKIVYEWVEEELEEVKDPSENL
ncbi:hypothetical protein HK099_001002 [Clydaea vesicula]|uniref:Uncharacterized protein n=1 Tax=Clydaea vesicula TaxID=447962 RepID=A0AAD5Y1E5_9FUNG|nr:hypothetical protein HK099_001002 [Clydaea vesicula]